MTRIGTNYCPLCEENARRAEHAERERDALALKLRQAYTNPPEDDETYDDWRVFLADLAARRLRRAQGLNQSW